MAALTNVAPARAQADLVLHHAQIYTVDPARPEAEALAVRAGRIVRIGTDAEILAAFPDAPRVDAGGRAVVPGLIDAHAHLMGLGTGMLNVDLVGARSKEEVVERLQAFAARVPGDDWLTGRGWDQNDWPQKTFPTRHDLDAAFPERPVWLRRIDGHAAWANTAALRAAGLWPRPPADPESALLDPVSTLADPEGGRVVRAADGTPTGVFIDAAMRFVDQHVPPPTAERHEEALRLALGEAARYGLTSVHDAGIDLGDVARYQRAIDAGWFTLRLYGLIGGRGATFDHFCAHGPLQDYKSQLTVRAVKFYIDGALGSRGAALLQPYADDPGNRGLLFQQPDAFAGDVRQAMACGFQVGTHAIGDRGNRVVLDAYARAIAATGGGDGRHRIEHAQVVAPEDLPRFAALGVIASMQPTHATSDMYWAEDRVGPARIAGAYAWRRLLDSGARLAFGSDFPVEHVDPLRGFYAAVTRQDAEGWPPGGWHPDQRLTRAEALRAFTLDAAYAAFQEDALGSLSPGKWADFVVLSRNIMTIPASEILGTEVVATYLGGRAVYGRLD